MRNLSFTLVCCFIVSVAFGQSVIDVVDNTVKVNALGGEHVFYLGFTEGDELIFNFSEANGKEMKEVEIIEYPSSSKFMDYKTKKVENKRISIPRTSIYKFRFHNSSIAGRVCRIKIQRIPASNATKNFNTTVYWKTLYDTSYATVQERFVEKSDTMAVQFFSQVVKLPAHNGTAGSNKSVMELSLPDNTIAWAYYLGVGDEGKEAHYTAREKFLFSANCGTKMPGYGAMAALALDGSNAFNGFGAASRVKYAFIRDNNNALLFQQDKGFIQYKQGSVSVEAAKMASPLRGRTYLGMTNENAQPTDVLVKATAIVVNEQYNTRTVQKMNVARREEPYLQN
jgi:hypothetical protein